MQPKPPLVMPSTPAQAPGASQGAILPVRLDPWQVLSLAAWFGVLTGLVELAFVGYRVYIQAKIVTELPGLLWRAPLADVLLFAVVGILLSFAAWLRPSLGSLRLVTFVYLALFLMFLLDGFDCLAWYTVIVLALGVSMQVSRLVGKRPWLLGQPLRWTTGWVGLLTKRSRSGAVCPGPGEDGNEIVDRRQVLIGSTATLAGLAAGVNGWQFLREQRMLAGLPAADPARLNVLFLVLDTVRAQSLSLNGYHLPTSPNLKRLASSGVSFERAIASAPWTLPSHAGMFTGRTLAETGVSYTIPYSAPYATLAQVLSDQGYQTAGFIGNTRMLCTSLGLDRGFSHYECHTLSLGQLTQDSYLLRTITKRKRIRPFLNDNDELGRKKAPGLNQAFLDWLERRGPNRPFFAFINYMDAHCPYKPKKNVAGQFGHHSPQNSRTNEILGEVLSADELDALRGAYEECILGLDQDVGWLLERLQEQGHLKDTVVIITSDHGDHFGEHGLVDHCYSLYTQLLHVPLIILHPTRVPAGKLVTQPVSLLDLPMTIWDLIGMVREQPFPGKSLAPLWEGGSTAHAGSDLPALSEVDPPPWPIPPKYPVSRGPMKSLVWREYLYIKNGDGVEELYNIEADLLAENNLAGSMKAKKELQFLRGSLDTVIAPGRAVHRKARGNMRGLC
jgi:arylsulfatase A-like enzyme